ncbi:MAG: hypothetical protein ACYDDD_10830 [Acidithiobacillus ferrivorans]
MKIQYFQDTDTLYIELRACDVGETSALQTAHAHLHFLTGAAQALRGDIRRGIIIRES